MQSISLGSDVNLGENIMFVLGSSDHFFSQCFTFFFSPSFGSISSSKPIGVRQVIRWTKSADQRREDHYYEALAFSQHNIDLVFGEENNEPEQLTMARENAGIDLSTMRVSRWYKKNTPQR